LSVGAYARAHGIPAQQIYDTIGRLRRRGAIPDGVLASDKFIAVKIAASPTINEAAVCRMLIPGGLIIECLQWPPPSWLQSIGRATDAAS